MKLMQALQLAILMAVAPAAAAQPVVRMFEMQTDPARISEFDAVGRTNMDASIRLEPGVRAMHAVTRRDTPGSVVVLEIYDDENAYERHIATPHFETFLESSRPLVVSKKLVE